MPADDPVDQQAARHIESSLRDAVTRLERPPIELEWLMALPKRIRRSGQLLETALAESHVLLDHLRAAWAKTRVDDQKQEDRIARARTLPRDLECLRAPDPAAWNGLGRRKKRCRAFENVGRAFSARQRLAPASLDVSSSIEDVSLLHPSSCHVPKRSPTPPGLREGIQNIPGLIYTANGPANAADYGLPTPCSPTPPPLEPPVPQVIPPPDFPRTPQPGEFHVQGHEIDPDFAYIVAHGRHSHAPAVGYSARRAAIDVHLVENRFPGALEYLAQLFFPAGVSQYRKMVDSEGMEPLLDFVYGWFDLARRAGECAK